MGGQNPTGTTTFCAELDLLSQDELPTQLRRLVAEQVGLILRRTAGSAFAATHRREDDQMPAVEASVVIARPVGDVWKYRTKADNLPDWASVIDRATQITDGPVAVGTQWRGAIGLVGIGFTWLVEFTHCELNKATEFTSVESKLAFTCSTTFEEVDGGTRFTCRVESETGFGGLFGKLTGPIAAKASSRALRASLENLADVLSRRRRIRAHQALDFSA